MAKLWHSQEDYQVVKMAQYLAGLTTQQAVWSEAGKALVSFFDADLVAFGERRADGETVTHDWILGQAQGAAPTSDQDLSATSSSSVEALGRADSGPNDVGSDLREAIAETLESGFLTSRLISTPEPLSLAFLPITQESQVTAVMLVGHRMSEPLPRNLLSVYLVAVAGLVGTTVTRLASERELRECRAIRMAPS